MVGASRAYLDRRHTGLVLIATAPFEHPALQNSLTGSSTVAFHEYRAPDSNGNSYAGAILYTDFYADGHANRNADRHLNADPNTDGCSDRDRVAYS